MPYMYALYVCLICMPYTYDATRARRHGLAWRELFYKRQGDAGTDTKESVWHRT